MSDNQLVAAKCGVAWGGWCVSKLLEAVGVTSWSEGAAMLAAVYTTLLIGEWVWKKFKAWRAS